MPSIIHRIGIKATESQLHAALTTVPGLAGWWTEDTVGETSVGGTITFSFRSPQGELVGAMRMEVTESVMGRVAWRCLEGPEDWVGTTFTFDSSLQDGMVILLFGHRGWAESTESMAHCSMKWAVFLLSLRDLVETGRGRPSPGDLKIDNWN